MIQKLWDWIKSVFTKPLVPAPVAKAPSHADTPPLPSQVHAQIGPALKFTLVNEGGFTNDPSDHGGATNFGITIEDLSQYYGRPATVAEVRAMSLDIATQIYQKKYWDIVGLGNLIDQNTATVIFDMGVLCGPTKAVKWAQEIAGVPQSGKVDLLTAAKLNVMRSSLFVPAFSDRAQAFFNSIGHGSQAKFLRGWTNRVDRLRKLA